MPPHLLYEAEDDLDDDAAPYWAAFAALSSRREVSLGGMGGVIDQPIPYGAISEYAADFGHKAAPRDPDYAAFLRMILAMDEVYLDHMGKLRKEQAEAATAKGRR